ncbi:AAA family ATPase [Duganella sp. FT80W]|uniref:DNA 3'-5' helicase II n=1 Tax=Duganella guangzhouensis TaxID=2666084 RepID=A0A6I2KWP4_9BURK|nr:ATP-dependent helicase [Duganella guangzhouensis]MRW88399.1 AAA family ATPase [Duganella guangzhouensis]
MSLEDQDAVVNAPLVDLSVVAGAGSGKTKTAIARVLAVLERIPVRQKVALLSFSNVAVNTFRRGLVAQNADASRVTVQTFDSFFTHYVIMPYAAHVMRCAVAPFLVLGEEPFLAGFNVFYGERSHPITNLKIRRHGAEFQAFLDNQRVPWAIAQDVIERIGAVGAYTYDIARYWVHRTLIALPFLVPLLVTRYPHVLVDEAQDIGSMDWALIQLLRQSGMRVTLIGDPAQAIFGFNGGEGQYLQEFVQAAEVGHYSLRTNFRSVPQIVACANQLTGRNDVAARGALQTHCGAFLVGYDPALPRAILDRFHGVVNAIGYATDDVAVICRAHSLVAQVRGGTSNRGSGIVKALVKAVDHRLANEYHLAYKECVGVVGAFLDPPFPRFKAFVEEAHTDLGRSVRAKIWMFVCDHDAGLPHSHLNARTQWLPALQQNLRNLLGDLGALGFTFADIGRRVTARDLEDSPLVEPRHGVRVDTVHQVKGESIGAVLYVATEQHARGLIAGTATENGRIGYVALTRARDIFWLAVPLASYERLVPQATAVGLVPMQL